MLQRYKKILIYAKKLKKYSRILQIYLHNSKKSSTFAPQKVYGNNVNYQIN